MRCSTATTDPDPDRRLHSLPPLGGREKIRMFWTQWQHFGSAGVSDEELMRNLAKVGATVFADWGLRPDRAKLAHAHGIRYFCGFATVSLRGPAREHQTRLAVDKTGKTCPERFDDYVAAGGDPNKPWGSWGEGQASYVPCPLDRTPWDKAIFEQVIDSARQGDVDGLHLDLEPYGAYGFDQPGDMLCYCDACFRDFISHRKVFTDVKREDRYAWLTARGDLEDYLKHLRTRISAMFRALAADVRAVHPHFAFSAYPDFVVEDLRADWRLQGMATGLHSPQGPFIVVNSTPYWEDPSRPWWDGPHQAYRRLGIKHVMGSWDAGIMGQHSESHVGAAELMYEMAMATDGFWRWGERVFDTNDWRSFALVNQRLRRIETKLGLFLFHGRDVPHFVTLVEQTGNPFLENALVVRTWQHNGRYLVRIFNGNTDWPIHVRVRFPRIDSAHRWRLRDPLHEVDYVNDGRAHWNVVALHEGLVVPIEGRSELFLLLERATGKDQPDRYRSVSSFDVTAHRSRPKAAAPLPVIEDSAGPHAVVYSRAVSGFYAGGTAGLSLVTDVSVANVKENKSHQLFGLQGYCREPRFSPDGKHIVASVFVNGKGQIYLINATDGQAQNISKNDDCNRSPRFSPDGTKIVYVSDREGDWDIYCMSIDGSNQRRLTHSPGTDRNAVFSPDGRRIAFISNRHGDFDVFVMNADSGDLRALVSRSGNEYEPIWSPNGRYVACTVQRRNMKRIEMVEVDGPDRFFVEMGETTNLGSLRFSPDGSKLAGAFTLYGTSGIIVTDITSRLDLLTETVEQKTTRPVQVESWKPHGTFWYTTGTGSPRMVAKTFTGLSFSPDGKTLVYCSDQSEQGEFLLYTIPVAGGDARQINGTHCAWPVNTDWARY